MEERWRWGGCENHSAGSWCAGSLTGWPQRDLGEGGGPGPFINPASDNGLVVWIESLLCVWVWPFGQEQAGGDEGLGMVDGATGDGG